MTEQLETFLAELEAPAKPGPHPQAGDGQRTAWLRTADGDQIRQLCQRLLERSAPLTPHADNLLATAFVQVARHQREGWTSSAVIEPDATLCELTARLYRQLEPTGHARTQLLAWLATCRQPLPLATLADLLAESPPTDGHAVATLLSPLFQRRDYDPRPLFPRLLDGLAHASAAAAILDLANFVTREHLMRRHPAIERLDTLVTLLAGVVGRLGRLESAAGDEDLSVEEAEMQVNEGVALAISLCDALALIGEKAVIGKLYQAMDLSHRRLRAEAAAALAKLGEQAGVDTLLALAAEPVVRLRVLAYAEELGLLDKVDEQYRSDQAEAEAELALWLSQPEQMGFPPTVCELMDTTTQAWPGYDEPVQCFLFRFSYRHGDREFANVGIAGPLVHAFGVDLTDLPPEEIYAAFAGWHAEHDEIYEVDVEHLDEHQRTDVVRLSRRLSDAGCEAIEPVRLGWFLGEKTLLARVSREAVPGLAVVDDSSVFFWPRNAHRRALGPDEVYWIYKGRRFLRTFNT